MTDGRDRSRATPPGPAEPPDGITVEAPAGDDRLDVLRVLDAAMLSVDADGLADRIDAGDVFVARAERTEAVVGALVTSRPEPGRLHVTALAVRRERRGRGIGSALVADAVAHAVRHPRIQRVTAAFDSSIERFYTDLGFEIDPHSGDDVVADGDDRRWGVLRVDTTE